ncbi:aldehyde-alcohol dehydrogenase 2 [Companilactobacillus paralimentarius DSM 13238 = JCM 10415]|uniref:Aldehyde-alcohol dehydrogenase 2 n=1 Tax=Companilactobacillus paralimentarius DSM 13238 = JCM 10415 TaxID=1122151 RepID=A0A0R1PBY7_9LACO|nr:acetaldehyde dehydrogenase (acetylating) [Companilactobacillus paralimentarius]KAE9564702.1 acetaldehyde dehydrogenase [Companilactobacillus paralimentarius]KRL29855.1 aldehyde-alcohol dehydrogenase 2 [Companilactobacillus paralimentarius DSM 13238 = JCM 10415]MDR4932618.1 acetaldehyde dehydrogenase (acetylating) [Companilactobacillus paralimentarius]QFR69200.1 acetaldehyde dehydrogenase (acetylating) [Companilactobacillus paralimentarius]
MENFDKDLRSIQEARDLARAGHQAAIDISTFSQEQIDAILKAMSVAGEKHAVELAQLAVEDTGFGNVADKTYKNHAAATLLYEQIKDEKTVGIISKDTELKTMDVAEPVGLVMGIVPSTNPTSTVIFKSMIALKARNAIVFAPHPAAAKCTFRAAEIMNEAAKSAGAPDNIITCVSNSTMGSTNELMHAKEIKLIIATGGPGMVKAAYSSGKPAIGVGAGNSPSYIERSADVKESVSQIIASKSFDYGTICASEQSIICEKCNKDEVVSELEKQGGYFMDDAETEAVCNLLFKNGGHAMDAKFVGRSPQVISKAAGFEVPADTKILIGKQSGVGEGNPLSYEKLTTVLAFYVVEDWKEACQLSIELLQNGIGHTMNLHTNREDIVLKFAAKPASRILVNTGGSQGGTGISTGLPISFTLGCGTCGGSSVSENVSPKHLLNIKKVAFGLKDVTTLVEDDKSFNHPELKDVVKECVNKTQCDSSLEHVTKDMSDKELKVLTELVRKTLSEMNA